MWKSSRVQLNALILILASIVELCAETVYMDRYGDCFHEGPFEVENESYIIRSSGGEPYDTLMCAMTFKSLKDDRLCLHFKTLDIRRCDVRLSVYSEKDASGTAMVTYSCHAPDLPQMVCSHGKYLTVLMRKKELFHGGYDFTLEVAEYRPRDAFTEGIDAFIVSISLIVGIIVGVIVIVIISAVIIVCCCCKKTRSVFTSQKSSSTRTTGYTDIPVIQPSAPPLLEDPPAYTESPPPYTDSEQSNTQTKSDV